MKLLQGDCLDILKTLENNSIDAIVTDPPYGLVSINKRWSGKEVKNTPGMETKEGSVWARKAKGFMGKEWDGSGIEYNIDMWRECYRVLKPGGYLLSFAGTRTYHKIASAIEDAGFEIRDMIMYVYGSGFPKSLNINKQLLKNISCGNMEEYERNNKKTKSQVSEMWKAIISSTLAKKENNDRRTLQEVLEDMEQGEQLKIFTSSSIREEIQISERQRQSCLERWSDLPTPQGELYCKCKVCSLPTGIFINGKKRWICYGTQTNNGETSWEIIDENGVCSSYQSQSTGQSLGELNVVCEQCGTQIIRSEGLGSALKPACEPITVARKPISEKNLASNFIKWGVGGINIDGCRISHNEETKTANRKQRSAGWNPDNCGFDSTNNTVASANPTGRFPANLIHDGSDEVVELFPNTKSGKDKTQDERIVNNNWLGKSRYAKEFNYGDSGSAARFFYCAKASKSERNMGCEGLEEKIVNDGREKDIDNAFQRGTTLRQNTHPTVKPIALMEYLIKLVSREGHTILDPFMGSGSTGIACKKLNRHFIGIEREPDYITIAENRIEAVPKTLF